ncbi:MAG: aldo/keto reductase [Candidatus Kariarchaeaceae archaeon]|jgi:aryl-alcohol dehydrogenase-like predicted oxidoreductase
MKYNNLGRTGVKVSELCLGTMNFGGRTGPEEADKIVNFALDAGINFVDTANVYGHNPTNFNEHRGRSESILGDIFQKNRRRDGIILATKAFYPMNSKDPNTQGSSRRHLFSSVKASLQRLQMDSIDLFQLHSPTNSIPIDETIRALDDLIKSERIHYIGTSGYATWQLVESLWVSKELGLNRFVTEQVLYNLFDRRIERELVPMALNYGIGLIIWSPLAGGFLTGKYKKGVISEDQRFGEKDKSFWGKVDGLFNDKCFELLEVVKEISNDKDVSMDQVAISWVTQQR